MLEVIATCAEDVKKIAEGGGQRIELVSALSEGGLTPSKALIEYAAAVANKIPVMVMVRPHAMGFVYCDADISIMERDIQTAIACGASGIVLGALTQQGAIDQKFLDRLLPHTAGKSVTFHKAIDQSADPIASLKIIASYPIDRVLTSGGAGKITDNVGVLREMVDIGGQKLSILAGGGVTIKNVREIIQQTQITQVHVGTAVRADSGVLKPIVPDLIGEFLREIGQATVFSPQGM